MGSFAATCPISRLAIEAGDAVFYICSKEKVETSYDLFQDLHRDIKNELLLEEAMKTSIREESNYISYLKTLVETKHVVFGFGTYDDYGGVEDVEIPDDTQLIMIRESVALSMITFGKTLVSREHYQKDFTHYQDNPAYCLLLVARLTRKELLGFTLLGRQYPDLEEMQEWWAVEKFIIKEAIQVHLDIMKRKYEYENWSFWVALKYKILRLLGKIK